MGPLNDEKNYKLTKRTTKNEKKMKNPKKPKMYNIINFKPIRYKVTASCNIIHSILNYKVMRLVNPLRLPKE